MTPSKEGESISAQKTLTSVKSINHPTEAKPVGHTLTKSSSSESDTTASMPTKPIVGVTTPKLGNTKGASIPEIPLEPTVAIATLLDPRKQIFEPSRPLNLPLLKFAQGRPKPPPLKLDVPKRPREPMLSPMGSGGSPATDRTPDLLRRKCSDPDGVSSDPENLAQTPTSAAFLENSGTAGRHSAGSSDLFAMSPPPSPGRPSLEERIKALDEKFVILEKAVKAVKTEPVGPSKPGTTSLATGSVPTQVASAAAAIAAANVDYKRYTIKKKTAGANPAWEPPISSFGTVTTGPSVGAILKSSIFDQDTQRLSSIEEKYTPGTYQRPPEPQESEMISPAGRLTTPLTLAIPSTLMGSSVTSPHNFYDNHDGSQRRLSDTQLLTGVNRPLPKPITPGSAAPSHGILKNPITPTGGLAPSQFPFPSSDPRLMISPTVPLSDPRIASRLKSPGADSSLSAPITPVVTVPASKPPMPYDIVKPTVTPQPVRPLVTPQTPITQNRSAAQKNEIPSGYNKPNSGGNVTAPRPEKTFGHTGNRPNPVCVGGKVAMRTTTQGKGDGKDAKNRDLDELFKASDIIERKAPPEKPKEPKDGDLTKKSAVGMPQKANKKPEESGGKISGATESKIDGVKKIPKLAEKRSDANNKGKEKVKSDKKDIQTIVKKRPDEVGKNSTDPEKKKSKEVKSQQSTKSSVATSSKVKPIQKTKVKKSHSKEQTDSDSEESSSNSDSDSDEERLMAKNANSKEWQEVLAALGDEPIGLSMYDRVKRRSSTLRVGPSKSPGEMKDKFSKLKEKRQSSKQHSEDSNGSRKLKNVRLEDDSSEDEDQDQRGNQSVSGQSSSSSEGEEETAKSTSEAHNSDKEKSSAATKFRVDDVFTSDEDDKDEKTEMKEKPKEKEGKTKLSAQLSASDGKKKEEKKVEKSSSDKNVDKTVKNRKRNLSGDERTEMKSTKPAKDGEEPPKKQSKSDDGQMQRKRGRPPKNSTSTSTGDGKKDKEKIKGDRDGTKPNKDKLKEKQKKLEKHSRRLKEEKEGGKKRKRDDSAEGEKKVKKPRKDVSDSDDQPASPILTKAAKKLVEVKTNSSVEGSGEQRKFITKGAMKEMSLNSTNSAPSRSALTSPQSENGSVDHQFGVVLEPEATIVPEETDGELTCPVEVSLAEVVVSDGNAIILPDGSADIIMTVAPSIHEKNEEFVDEATLVNAKTEENDQRLQEMEPSSPNENLGLPETSSPVHPATAESAVESLVKRELMEDAKQLIVLESSISSMELSRQLKEEPIVERLATPPTAPQTTEGRINDQSLPTCDGQRQQHHQLDGSGRILPSHVDKVIDDVVHGYIEMDPDELIKISRQRQLAQQASMPQAVRKSSLSTEGTEPVSRPPQNVPTTSSAAVALPSSLQSQQPVATTTSSSVIREFTESLVSSTDFASHLTSAAAASFINFAQPPYEGLLAAQQQQQQQDYLRHLQQQQQQQKSTSVLVPPGSRLPPSFDIIGKFIAIRSPL